MLLDTPWYIIRTTHYVRLTADRHYNIKAPGADAILSSKIHSAGITIPPCRMNQISYFFFNC